MHAPIDHVAEEVDDLCPHTRSSGREGVRSKQKDGPYDILRKRRPDADRVASQEIALERAELVMRHAHGREVAETGVDAVNRVVSSSDLRDDFRGLPDLALRGPVGPPRPP